MKYRSPESGLGEGHWLLEHDGGIGTQAVW